MSSMPPTYWRVDVLSIIGYNASMTDGTLRVAVFENWRGDKAARAIVERFLAYRGWRERRSFDASRATTRAAQKAVFADCVRTAERGAFDVIVTASLGSVPVGGSTRFLELLARLAHRGVRFVAVEDFFDSAAPTGRLILQVLLDGQIRQEFLFADHRLAATEEPARAEEEIYERARSLVARYRPRTTPHADPQLDLEVARLRGRGATIEKIAKKLRISVSTVFRCLRRIRERSGDASDVLASGSAPPGTTGREGEGRRIDT